MDEDQNALPDEPQTEAADGKCAVVRHQIVESALFVTDAELIRRIGVPEKIARAALHALDRDKGSGFPQKKAFWVIAGIGRP